MNYFCWSIASFNWRLVAYSYWNNLDIASLADSETFFCVLLSLMSDLLDFSNWFCRVLTYALSLFTSYANSTFIPESICSFVTTCLI